MLKFIIFPLFLCLALSSNASNDFVEAGKAFNINPKLLWAIAYKESRFNAKAINRANKNKTYDIGIMQINSTHLNKLEKEFGISEKHLFENPRINIFVGAMILRKCFDLYGENEKGITCYNGLKKDNPYGKEVLKIIKNAEKNHQQKQTKQIIKNYFKAEKERLFVKAVRWLFASILSF